MQPRLASRKFRPKERISTLHGALTGLMSQSLVEYRLIQRRLLTSEDDIVTLIDVKQQKTMKSFKEPLEVALHILS
jgi:hypothetical protein